MNSTTKIAFDKAKIEPKIIEETDDHFTMPCIIAREMVQPYADIKFLKAPEELEKAAWTAEGRWVTLHQHPETALIMRSADIKGRIVNVNFVKDLVDVKTSRPMDRGIKSQVQFFKKKMTQVEQDEIKQGIKPDVSIGFTYTEDMTPGEWRGQHYDGVQRNIFIDHLVAGADLGRCPSPLCGVGLDSIGELRIGLDPWETTEEYIRSGHREPPASDECKTIVLSADQGLKAILCKYGSKWEIQSYLFEKDKWTVAKAKAWFKEHSGDTAFAGALDDFECPACKRILANGLLTSSKRLYAQYGADVLEVIEGNKVPTVDDLVQIKLADLKKQADAAADKSKKPSKTEGTDTSNALDSEIVLKRSRELLKNLR